MTTITLTRTEASFLHAAAADAGRLHFAPTMKAASRERLLARFLRDGLITPPVTQDGRYLLTAEGYKAIGLTPPAAKPAAKAASAEAGTSKKAQVLALLARETGATLPELMTATGWLPHTVRAALSRLRSGGQPLAKVARPDAAMAYRILPPAPATASRSPRKSRKAGPAATAEHSRADAPTQVAA